MQDDMHACLLNHPSSSREMTTPSSAAASSLLGRKDLAGRTPPRDDSGRDEQDLKLGRLGGLQNGINTPNMLCKEYIPNTFPLTPWKLKIGGNKFKENYYKFIEVRNRENFSYQVYSCLFGGRTGIFQT